MKTKLDDAIDRICAGTITRECDALERLGSMTDDARMVVDAYSEAQARIEALESVAKYMLGIRAHVDIGTTPGNVRVGLLKRKLRLGCRP